MPEHRASQPKSASFVCPWDTLITDIEKLERQIAHATSRIKEDIKLVSELEAERDRIASALSAMRTAKGGSNG